MWGRLQPSIVLCSHTSTFTAVTAVVGGFMFSGCLSVTEDVISTTPPEIPFKSGTNGGQRSLCLHACLMVVHVLPEEMLLHVVQTSIHKLSLDWCTIIYHPLKCPTVVEQHRSRALMWLMATCCLLKHSRAETDKAVSTNTNDLCSVFNRWTLLGFTSFFSYETRRHTLRAEMWQHDI